MSSSAGKPIQCRAAVIWEPKTPLSIENIEVAPPQAGEVRVKVVASGICRSDHFYMQGLQKFQIYPSILGHEGAGIVESVGEGVTSVQPGDHVSTLFNYRCRECALCKSPYTNLCLKLRFTQRDGVMPNGTPRFTCKGKAVYHFMGTSTFSEYTVCAEINLCKIDPTAPLDKVCLLSCGVPTGYGAAIKTAKVYQGSTCAVWGLGTLGLACIMGCKKAGAKRIIAIDVNPDKFEIATRFGATESMNPKDLDKPIHVALMEATGGGCDFTFECVGNTKIMEDAYESCHVGGGVTTVIGVSPAEQRIAVDPLFLLLGRTLKGTYFGDYVTDDVPGLVDEYMKGDLKVDEFITHTMGLDQINEAFDLMVAGKSIRTVIVY